MSAVLELSVTEVFTEDDRQYQCLAIEAKKIKPQVLDAIALPKNLDLNRGVVLWGSAPTWLYARLVRCCDKAPWVGCYSVKDDVVIAASRSREFEVGDSFRLVEKLPCPAILIGGPPDSGKSVLSRALDNSLASRGFNNRLHLHRAQWDGQGDWYAEMSNRQMALDLSLKYGGKPPDTLKFFQEQAETVAKLRATMDLVLVDFGGLPKASDVILLERCTDYIIISSKVEAIPQWHEFCGKQGKLQCLAVIRSVLEDKLEVLQTEPYLEIIAGPWEQGVTFEVPDVLLRRVLDLLDEYRGTK